MNISENISLAHLSTMRLGGNAAYATDVHNRQDVADAHAWALHHNLPVLMIGGGSNIIWKDEGFPGLVLVNKIMGYEPFEEDAENYYLTVGAGEIWDNVVARTVEAGASGIEALSLIPGTAGATPIQNVGAYGQEIASVLVSVEVYELGSQRFTTIAASDCQFGYRTSRFKTSDKGKYFVTGLTLHLMKRNPEPPFYRSVQAYFDEHHLTNITPQVLRDAVIDIRSSKLPDPAVIANTGSFFANPIISETQALDLAETYPGIPLWPAGAGQKKLPAAWLIENAGLKDYHDQATGMATWPKQPLVFINENARSTSDLLAFKAKIVAAVQDKFGITLQQEPELLP